MPELPDVECMRQYLHATALHREIAGIEVSEPSLLRGVGVIELHRLLRGKYMTDTARHGGCLFVNLDGALWLAMLFGTGSRLLYSQAQAMNPGLAMVVFCFRGGDRLAYISPGKLGSISLISSPLEFIRSEGLGLDALDRRLDLSFFKTMLQSRRCMVKSLLMDQQTIAGIGSTYSDEILFQSRIHPARVAGALSEGHARALFSSLKSVLGKAIRCGSNPELMPKGFLTPVRRAGSACPRCGAALLRRELSGRIAVFCPCCQPEKEMP